MAIDSQGWTAIGAIVTNIVGLIYVIVQNHFQLERMKLTYVKVEQIQKTGEKTATAVNGQLSTSLVTGAVSAQALAMANPNQLNNDLAAAASKAATDHLERVATDAKEAKEAASNTPQFPAKV